MKENELIARILVSVILFARNPRPSHEAKRALIETIRKALREAVCAERAAAGE